MICPSALNRHGRSTWNKNPDISAMVITMRAENIERIADQSVGKRPAVRLFPEGIRQSSLVHFGQVRP